MTDDEIKSIANTFLARDWEDETYSQDIVEFARAVERVTLESAPLPDEPDPDHFLVKVRRVEGDETAALLAKVQEHCDKMASDAVDAARFRCLMDNVGTVWIEDLFEFVYEDAEIIARIDAKRAQRGPGLPVIEPKK